MNVSVSGILLLLSFSSILFLVFAKDAPLSDTHYRCLDTISHKKEPGPEGELFKQCTPWKNVSCCTYNTTSEIHDLKKYNFNFDHCPEKKTMSPECKKHFVQDYCFYECSPNVGPWVTKVKSKYRNERFYGVPLCKEECESWFSACADDYTCTDNWARNFVWTSGSNKCIEGSVCLTFKEIFETSKNFCEKVWDGSWAVVEEPELCMKMWFDGSKGNPNDIVAKLKTAEYSQIEINHSSGSTVLSISSLKLVLFYLLVTCMRG